jgi:hypothetical protein
LLVLSKDTKLSLLVLSSVFGLLLPNTFKLFGLPIFRY